MRIVLPISVALLCACSSERPAQTFTMSTEGSTVVRSAVVTRVSDITTQQAAAVHEVTVRFDNGDERGYSAEPGENFHVGDKVKVATSKGVTRISR